MSKKKPTKKSEEIIVVSNPALEIAMMQLEMLKKRARYELLTLEETKQYDLLCKNLNLLNGDPTSIEAEFKKLNDIDEKALLEIVKEPKKPNDD